MINQFKDNYSFLSNFFPCCVELDGALYPTVEHAFQAAKTTNLEDRIKICAASIPGEAKRLGRKLQLRNDWEAVKIEVMKSLLEKKFQLPALREALLATGDQELVEGNYWGDAFWGFDLNNDRGENHLGKLLMDLRGSLND